MKGRHSQWRYGVHPGKRSDPAVEGAVGKLRERLRELEAKLGEHREEVDRYASAIAREYSAQLKKFHEGHIPTRSEHHRLAWPKPYATERGRRYMRGFGRVEWKRSFLKDGQTYEAYSGYETFGSWVHMYWWHEKKATVLQARIDALSAKLSELQGPSTTGSIDT